MPHSHDILHDELQGFDAYRYTDIEFIFSGDAKRKITYRLVFCKDESNNEMLERLFEAEAAELSISVVSFYNIDAENFPECDSFFEKPPGAPDLNAAEGRYLYDTLFDIIVKIAETECIQILTFTAYSEKLRRLYSRLVGRYAAASNLENYAEGANFVVRMGYQDEKTN